MRTTFLTGAVALCLSGLSYNCAAASVLFDNFDSYADQAALDSVWTPIGSGTPAGVQLSTAQSASSPNSVWVGGTTLNNMYRSRRTFSDTPLISTTTLISWSFDFFDSNPATAPQRNYSNLQDTTGPTGTGQLIGMGLNNNQLATASGGNYYMARILGYTVPTTADPDGGPMESVGGAGAYFKLNDFGVGLRSLGWHNLRVEIGTDDGLSADFSFFVDGVLAERVSNVGSAATFRGYDNIAIGSGLSNGSMEAFFDNMSLQIIAVPEPSVFALGLVGAAALVIRRMRRD